MNVEFRVLGAVEVHVDGRAVDVGHARQRHVLAALLVDANNMVTTEQLLWRVWGDHAPQRAAGTLRSYLSRLRGVLASVPDVDLVRRAGGHVLAVDRLAVDVYLFRHLVEKARAVDDECAERLLSTALGLWRGEALATLDSPWVTNTRESFDRERLAAAFVCNEVALRRGRHAEVLVDLTVMAAAHPLDERLAAQLMLALCRCGRHADALEHYHATRLRLADELGVDPSPTLQRTYRQVLTGDAAVEAPVLAPQAPQAPAGRERRVVPWQLPGLPGSFVGRRVELAALDKIMTAGSGGGAMVVISAIGGAGGVGKTWLALRWAHDNVELFPDGQLYLNLRGFDPAGEPVTAEAALRRLLDALGVDPARVPADTDARAAMYRTLLRDKRMLIVLDNARDSATVVPLLPGGGSCAVLVTSRHRLAGLFTTHAARPLTLDVLPDDEALELLSWYVGKERLASEAAAVPALLEHSAGLPLALGIVGARAALHADLPLTTLAAELTASTHRLDALDAGELEVNLRAVLSCSVLALAPAAARVFALLGLATGPDIGLAAASSLAGLPAAGTRTLLGRLVNAHLLHGHVPGRYRLHDLVRLYAAELANQDRSAADDARRRLLDHCLHTAYRAAMLLSPHRDPLAVAPPAAGVVAEDLPNIDAAVAWFDAEHPMLLAAVEVAGAAGFDVHACQLPWTLATYFDRRGRWQDWLVAQRVAIDAAGRLEDRPQLAQAHRLAANACSNLRHFDDARTHLDKALELFDELGDDTARAHVHFDIALAHDRQDRPDRALGHAQRSLALYRIAGVPIKEAVALNTLGWYLCRLGDHRAAIRHCEQALAIAEQIGSQYGQANTWDSLGYAHHHLVEHERARTCYRRAIELFRGLGDRHAEAITLDHLGDTQQAAGQAANARQTWQHAAAILTEVGHPDADSVRTKLL